VIPETPVLPGALPDGLILVFQHPVGHPGISISIDKLRQKCLKKPFAKGWRRLRCTEARWFMNSEALNRTARMISEIRF
jgi:hypothetical protein